jgi:[ribosomal protein S5]-alanine N-acetyltransferase
VTATATRIVLRAPAREDEAEFVAAMQASRSLHLPWLYAPQTAADYREYLVRALLPSSEFFFARRQEDDAITGFLNLSEIVRGSFQSAYLGYGAVAAFAGRGYMTEAIALVLDQSFARLGLHRVEANIQPDNAASIALVRRCGFQREGFSPRYLRIGGAWKDHERWAIRSEGWSAAQH